MKEPKTVAEAKRLTLRKILECMELPIGERKKFWFKDTPFPEFMNIKEHWWFCYISDFCNTTGRCFKCPTRIQDVCIWFSDHISHTWLKKDLRKLYKMIEAIEC